MFFFCFIAVFIIGHNKLSADLILSKPFFKFETDNNSYLAIFIPQHSVVPGEDLTVEYAIIRCGSGAGDGSPDLHRFVEGDAPLLEWVRVGLAN